MEITALRKEMALSLEAFAGLLGLKSKGHLSQLERGEQTPSVRVALKIEQVSGGRISAATLNPDVMLVRCAPPIQPQDQAA
jgi:transcriptional regulator with XRE-family HTH domain